jgi:hypothetical protein
MFTIALLVAAQAAEPQAFTPEEERAVVAIALCQKRYFDSVASDERRRKGESLIDESWGQCTSEEEALRTMLQSRFNASAVERVMQIVRNTGRDSMINYIKR